ncbi:CvpA family protein [Mangrovitalea sediminis]|uniref:CvpA family protein n=1 Tax=Mangrovitalea sediminis TaxID=1982043 RepID=UPI000BE528B4|nr:CvpA family protein [Mangrovitalea sediminis]
MKALIWIDWVIIAVIGFSTLVSLMRGFVREALSLVTWVAAFIVARTFHPHLQALLEGSIQSPLVRLITAFAILFIATLIVGAVVNNLVSKLVHVTGLTSTDRVLGMGFGLLRGVIVVVVAIAILRYTPMSQQSWWRQSIMVDKLGMVEQWSRRVLGDQIQQISGPHASGAMQKVGAAPQSS